MNRFLALVALILFFVDAAALLVWWTYPEPPRRLVPDLPPAAPGPPAGLGPAPGTQPPIAPPLAATPGSRAPLGLAPLGPEAPQPGTTPARAAAASAAIVNTSKGPMSLEDAISIIAFAPPQAQSCIAQVLGPNAVERIRAGQLALTQENIAKAEDCLDGAKSPPVSQQRSGPPAVR